ncbi:MAG: preprotein translocase subunit SecG [Alistipes sp.]|nr:preprotein translocase subunit SecG [Alistipes sp.]
MLYIVFIILILIASVLIVLTVLAQNPKGGMAANFGASNQVMGVRQTSDFLEKFTWTLAVSILVLSLAATMAMPKNKIAASRSGIEKAALQNMEGNEFMLPNQFGVDAAAAAGAGEVEAEIEPEE